MPCCSGPSSKTVVVMNSTIINMFRLKRCLKLFLIFTVTELLVLMYQKFQTNPYFMFPDFMYDVDTEVPADLLQYQTIPNLNHPYFTYDVDAEEPVDLLQACHYQRFHPFDPSILKYLSNERKPIRCRAKLLDSLTYINDSNGLLFVNESVLSSTGYKLSSNLHCVYQSIFRSTKNDDDLVLGAERLLAGDLDLKRVGISVSDSDFVQVVCTNLYGIVVYENIHAHISHGQPTRTGKNVSSDPPSVISRGESMSRINVLIFGVDSISRLSFIRLLPKTYHYLTKKLGAYVLRGMNKVADNSFPNLVPLLTGKKAYGGGLPSVPHDQPFHDDWPLIWKNYSSAGYRTFFAEDMHKYGLFNYLSTGFKNQPTDHYFRPFWLAFESSSLSRTSSNLCFRNDPKHRLQIDYLKRFLTFYSQRGEPFFAFFFLAEISHDNLNRVMSVDEDFVDFLEFLSASHLLNNTLFIFMSDHGHRYDAIRETLVGRIEERMPMFSLRLPEVLKRKYPHLADTLVSNTGRLITPYDTYSTLLDLILYVTHGDGHPPGSITKTQFGQSLLSAIPANRTCSVVGIPDHYCACQDEVLLKNDDPRLAESSKIVVDHLNKLVAERGSEDKLYYCAQLNLVRIKSGYLLKTRESGPNKLRVIVETNPGHALFEATVRMTNGSSTEFQVLDDVSRINIYGNQSSCVKDAILRKYCYCKKA